MGTSNCVLDERACKHLDWVSKILGTEPSTVVRSLPLPEQGMSPEEYHRILVAAKTIVRSMGYLLSRGFDRLLRIMTPDHVFCIVERSHEENSEEDEENNGFVHDCSDARGFSIYLVGAEDNAPAEMVLEAVVPRSEPMRIAINVQAAVTRAAEGLDTNTAHRVARRVTSYAKRTNTYQYIEDIVAMTDGDYDNELTPEVEEGAFGEPIITIHLDIYASAVPGYLLPFDLNPVLDLAEYLYTRLEKGIEKARQKQ